MERQWRAGNLRQNGMVKKIKIIKIRIKHVKSGKGNYIKKYPPLPVRSEICCGQGQYHGFGVKPPLLWKWLSCYWCSRLRNCLCWQSWKRRTCCWGWLRSHLLPGSEGGRGRSHRGAGQQFSRGANSSSHQRGKFKIVT